MTLNGSTNGWFGDGFSNRIRPRFGMGGFGFGPFRMIRGLIGLAVLGIVALFSLPAIWRDQGVPEDVINTWVLIGWIIFAGALIIIGVIIIGVRSKKKREAAKVQTEIKPSPPVTQPLSVTPVTPPSTQEASLFSRFEEKEGAGVEEQATGVAHCIHCGKEILEGSIYCIHCGKAQ